MVHICGYDHYLLKQLQRKSSFVFCFANQELCHLGQLRS